MEREALKKALNERIESEDFSELITADKFRIYNLNYQNYDNLRSIKRNVMNRFVGLVGKDSAWKEYVNSEQGEQDCQ